MLETPIVRTKGAILTILGAAPFEATLETAAASGADSGAAGASGASAAAARSDASSTMRRIIVFVFALDETVQLHGSHK
jgi:F0F1-type ATP synthase membrane subunit c/vacuolar-type H+-ATPase subunit K